VQSHFHANPRLTRIILPFLCCTTMQGPSHASHAHDSHPHYPHTHPTEPRSRICFSAALKNNPRALPVLYSSSLQCRLILLPTRQHYPPSSGYKRLQRATQFAPTAAPMQQNASKCTGPHFAHGAAQSPSPVRKGRKYRTSIMAGRPTPTVKRGTRGGTLVVDGMMEGRW